MPPGDKAPSEPKVSNGSEAIREGEGYGSESRAGGPGSEGHGVMGSNRGPQVSHESKGGHWEGTGGHSHL